MPRIVALTLFAAAAGCINIPDTPAPQCYSNSDCDQATGEVCAEGVCYGDPPSATFGVSISPPASRVDLTSVERKDEDLPASGLLTDLILETPVTLTGSVTAAACIATGPGGCPTGTLGAAVTISRPPRFAGGDGFTQTTQSTADATAASFTLTVPRTRPGVDPPYTITVVPADLETSTGSATAPAELVPPLRTTLDAGSDTQMPIALGGDDLVVLTGDLTDSDGASLTDYRVSAVGRWVGDTSNSEVSSIAYTPDGHFAIALSAGLDPAVPVTIVAKPLGTDVAPTLELLAGIDPTQNATLELAQPSAIGAAQVATVTITGTSTSGAVLPVAGARVIAVASASAASAPQLAAVITADVTTGSDGTAQLALLDGQAFATAGYELRVVPPAGSSLAVLDQASFQVADATVLLVPRVAIQGTVVDATGVPVANVSVTAQPSLQFTWSLDDNAQVFLAQIPAATAVTGDDGDFVVFVDPTIEAVPGFYDLAFEPPTGSSVPSYTDPDLAIPMGTVGPMMIALGNVALPVAANLHGQILDPDGGAVSGGELRVFRLATDNTLCTQVPHAPPGCAVPAQLQAHATSDDSGEVRFTLPR